MELVNTRAAPEQAEFQVFISVYEEWEIRPESYN